MDVKPSLMSTRYHPVEDGYEIIGSREIFNRTLYGSHAQDDSAERYFTFAGDLPIVMGALTDWTKDRYCNYAKSGMLMSGLAMTAGHQTPWFYSNDVDVSSRWLHDSEDIVATFRNGWMEYELRQFSSWMPDLKVHMEVFPLLPEDGFLVHYRITTNQRVIFCAGFGGITKGLGRFEYAQVKERHFHSSDCEGNIVSCGKNRARVKGPDDKILWIGSSFSVDMAVADGAALERNHPGLFLGDIPEKTSTPVVRMSHPIGPGETLDGFIVVVRHTDEKVLDQWLSREDPIRFIKQQIHAKRSAISMVTPDPMLNLTIPPTVLAMDASWHAKAFHHGAHAYHAPFLGWRNWYGPTVIGWHNRVKTAIQSHFSEIVKDASGKEKVWYDGLDRPDLDHEGTQYHHIENSTGFIPCILGARDIYNMQEVAVDMAIHHLEWQGDLKFVRELFEDLAGVLDWEERILDPDHDGLYQNFLNTWISDGHSYNGGGCAQASAYNYFANLVMSKMAEIIGRPNQIFKNRTENIRKAILKHLWLPSKGLLAEFIDTIGHKLVHPSPELSTIYLAIDCGVVDEFQACQMLTFTETILRNERTRNRNGRLVYSSNWYPKKYSTCGLFPAENLHLALMYFKLGLKEKSFEILDAIIESYFMGKNPGLAAHVLSAHGVGDGGDLDFSDVSSMYLRTIVEGLYGIRFHLLDDVIEIAPNIPADWTQTKISVKDISLCYSRQGGEETFTIYCEKKAQKKIKIPMRSADLEGVFLNGELVHYRIEPHINNSFLIVETDRVGRMELKVHHGRRPIPMIRCMAESVQGNQWTLTVTDGKIITCEDPSGTLAETIRTNHQMTGTVRGEPGFHTIFVRVQSGEYDAWLKTTLKVSETVPLQSTAPLTKKLAKQFEPMDISSCFNTSLTEIHKQKYFSPRPKGYSIGVRLNGRYAWDWNHAGHNAVRVEDTGLREVKDGRFISPSGIAFITPKEGPNVACVSMWDNFPAQIEIPLKGKASELALFLIGSTNAMQCYVENARVSVLYDHGKETNESLVHLKNFDDWLTPALQQENETVYFSEYNHGLVQRISLDPTRSVKTLTIEAIANEVIIGLLGISIRK